MHFQPPRNYPPPQPAWRGAALFAFLVLVSILALVGLEVALEWIAVLVYGALA